MLAHLTQFKEELISHLTPPDLVALISEKKQLPTVTGSEPATEATTSVPSSSSKGDGLEDTSKPDIKPPETEAEANAESCTLQLEEPLPEEPAPLTSALPASVVLSMSLPDISLLVHKKVTSTLKFLID